MPKIHLKDKSPEYADSATSKTGAPECAVDGCQSEGTHRAPKARNSDEYYNFCLDHVQQYNASWNYFDGMSQAEIQQEMLKSLYGDRPTWKQEGNPTDTLHRKAWEAYNFTDFDGGSTSSDEEQEHRRREHAFTYHRSTPEYEAMSVLNLEPPVDLDILKKRYKELAKKFHPDRNQGCEKAEEQLKQVNAAYTILKKAFEKYEKMMDS